MHFIPSTKEEEKMLLKDIEISDFSDLVKTIPNKLQLQDDLGIGAALSELEISENMKYLANKNNSDMICFLGAGVYDHFIPVAVDFISNRSEYYTAYTPYQAEVSQGTLQYLYEFQTMICELSGMDISNASLYDCASAISEACTMALSVTQNTTIMYSSLLNPNYIEVINTYFSGKNVKLIELPAENGMTNLSAIKTSVNDIAAVILQSPNKFGLIESWSDAKYLLTNSKGLLISVSDPISLTLLKSPGECGADIFVGEGQSIGNHMNYGGPMIGLMAIKEKYKRRMPGRIIGKTVDNKNNVGFVLTLQTREQHIRRANATSNICTNQGLLALRSAIYLSLMGKHGLPYVANLCYQKSQYAANRIAKLSQYTLLYSTNFLKEFIIKTELSAKKVINHCESNGILIAGVDMDVSNSLLQIAVTEKRTKKEIDLLINTLQRID